MIPERTPSRLFETALRLASIVHAGQCRKGTTIPYITHPVHVARLLDRDGQSGPLVLAGLLHDVLEDFERHDHNTWARLRAVFSRCGDPGEPADERPAALARLVDTEFGSRTLALVLAVTEPDKDRDWIDRKRETLDRLKKADPEVVVLKTADALHNAWSVLSDIEDIGPTVFHRFNACKENTVWYYGEIARISTERLRTFDTRLPPRLQAVVEELRTAAGGSRAGRP